jgi:TetR/AcrR family transcriptional regulator, transcriptional repressor for nem operon
MARAENYDRDAALDAAMALFWRKGFHATSLKDLEASLQMKPGSIYAAFESKETLYLLALRRYFDASLLGFRTYMAQAASPLAGLVGHFQNFAQLSPDDRSSQACMLTKTLVDTKSTNPAIAQATQGYLDEIRDEFARAFEAARVAGELPQGADPQRLARRYQANISALRIEIHRGSPKAVIDALAEDMAQELLTVAAQA